MEWTISRGALVALRLIAHRAALDGRENVTLGDIAWAIDQIECETQTFKDICKRSGIIRQPPPSDND